ncbi:MAG: hypothetical protein V7785_13060 [Bermanella sp.]
MDKTNKYIYKERKVGPHISVQSGLAFFVTVMGALFYLDAAAGTQSVMSILTMVFGVLWFVLHHGMEQWHHSHHHDHIHH